MKYGVYSVFVILGAILGFFLFPASRPFLDQREVEREVSKSHKRVDSPRLLSLDSPVDNVLARESEALNYQLTLKGATEALAEDRRSPLRDRSFLKLRIDLMESEALYEALSAGDIQTTKELEHVAHRLTMEDEHALFEAYMLKRDYRIKTQSDMYAFRDQMIRTWLDHKNAEELLKRVQGMKRGGGQQDFSYYFSTRWAYVDPPAATAHFDELVYLRNMNWRRKLDPEGFANIMIDAWLQKGTEEFEAALTELPAGDTKRYLQAAYDSRQKKPE